MITLPHLGPDSMRKPNHVIFRNLTWNHFSFASYGANNDRPQVVMARVPTDLDLFAKKWRNLSREK